MTREYDPIEEELIETCANDCYKTITHSSATRTSKWFNAGDDMIAVRVQVYPGAAKKKPLKVVKKPKK